MTSGGGVQLFSSRTLNVRLSRLLLLLGLLVFSLLIVSLSMNQESDVMAAEAKPETNAPPIDRAQPAQVKTATFALG